MRAEECYNLVKSEFLHQNSKLALCGVSTASVRYYLNKNKFSKIEIVSQNEDYDFIIMTNRIAWGEDMKDFSKVTTCFDKFEGKNLSIVKRNGLVLSTIREKIK